MVAARRILTLFTNRSPSNVLPKVHCLEEATSPEEDLGLKLNPTTPSTEGAKQETTTIAMSNLKVSPRHDLAMVFTCKVCEMRPVKTTCKESYEKGVVVVRCGGCNNLHLIADCLGWFGEPSSVEDFLTVQGEELKRGSGDTLNLKVEDLAGSGAKP